MSWTTGKCELCCIVFSDFQGDIPGLIDEEEALQKGEVEVVNKYRYLKPYGYLNNCPICQKTTAFIAIQNLSDW